MTNPEPDPHNSPLTPSHRPEAAAGRPATLFWLAGLVVAAFLIVRHAEKWLRTILLYLSGASWTREMVTRWPIARRVAYRFVAGETIDDALATTRQLNIQGMLVTLDYLGESVTNADEARAARDEILNLLDCIAAAGVKANVSVKLSQLGVKISKDLALANMVQLLRRAGQHRNKVRMDMEDSSLVETTLGFYQTLRYDYELENVGVVIQSYLYRSEDDVRKLIKEGAWVRLCKGAYMEPPHVAFPDKDDTDANFIKLMQMMLSDTARENGVHLAIASHDLKMIEATLDYAAAHDIPTDAFEFQMLFGIRRELQEELVAQGQEVRIYVPYGTAWYPYFVRRLAERPANLWFFLSNLVRG